MSRKKRFTPSSPHLQPLVGGEQNCDSEMCQGCPSPLHWDTGENTATLSNAHLTWSSRERESLLQCIFLFFHSSQPSVQSSAHCFVFVITLLLCHFIIYYSLLSCSQCALSRVAKCRMRNGTVTSSCTTVLIMLSLCSVSSSQL